MRSAAFVFALALDASGRTQQVMSQDGIAQDTVSAWSATLSRRWDVLGPFPIRAREQHLLSPAFPLQASELSPSLKVADNQTWPSSLADGGSVSWSTVVQDDDGHLSVSFPAVRWGAIRATEGWAALQHHALLRTTLTVNPPGKHHSDDTQPHLVVKAVQTSFFAILPRDRDASYAPEWHAGNIYAYPHAPIQAIALPPLNPNEETVFDVLLSADCEIRLFGDPQAKGRELPIIEIDFSVELESEDLLARESQLDVTPDFVDGYAFGNVLGLGLRNVASSTTWEVVSVQVAKTDAQAGIAAALVLERPIWIAPLQTRVLTVRLQQDAAFRDAELVFDISVRECGDELTVRHQITVNARVPLNHRISASVYRAEQPVLRATHFLAGTAVQMLAVPPLFEPDALPIVYLHGAGVEIDHPELHTSLTRQKHSWIAYPSGRTSWGFDWHGPSARHALSAAPALSRILTTHPTFASQPAFAEDTRFVLVGHSNGGQGAWFVASRHPDRVAAVMPAAAYMKSQAYVPWALERGAHYADPILAAVLKASMTGDDNDLFVGNLVGKKVLALHGGADENVPTWHTRELVSVLRNWAGANASQNDVNFIEMPGKPHWYPDYFAAVPTTQAFLDDAVRLPPDAPSAPTGPGSVWTITVAWPHESGSLHGFSVSEVDVPGRLARLTVEMPDEHAVLVKTSNVRRFSLPLKKLGSAVNEKTRFVVDGTSIPYAMVARHSTGLGIVPLQKTGRRSWEVQSQNSASSRPVGPASHALDTSSTITIIVPEAPHNTQCRSAALRLAHTLLTYLALDVEVISAADALSRPSRLDEGSIIVLSAGTDEYNEYIPESLRGDLNPFRVERGQIIIDDYVLDEHSTGAILVHPGAGRSDSRLVYVVGNDAKGLERALRLFPFRTGVPIPEWIVLSADADERAGGGVQGAGFWDRRGAMNEGLQHLAWTQW